MTQPFLALITPIGGIPDQGLPQPQPPIGAPPGVNWPTFPSNPIAPGGLPGAPSHPIYNPPYPSTGPGFPTHPIAPGGPIGSVPPPQINIPVFPGQLPSPGGPGQGGGGGEAPDQSLPPPQPGIGTLPSGSFILVWSPQYGWILVAQGGQPPINQGPSGEKPDQSLPGAQPGPDQSLPEGGNKPTHQPASKK